MANQTIYPNISVNVANFPSLQPVTGALTDSQLRASPLPVSGALTLSGSVSVSNFPASQLVTGAFYPSIQPVSGTVGVTQSGSWALNISNFPASQAVTGAFFQATQPVSLASSPLPTGAALDASIQTLIGRFFSSTATISISAAILTAPAVKIISANSNRKGLYIYNNSANSIYIAFGSAANSATNMTQLITTFASFILPFPVYQGDIYAVRNAGSGNALITELT